MTVKKPNEETLSKIKKFFDTQSIEEVLNKLEITDKKERDLIKKILQTATYTDGVNVEEGRFYFTLGEEILGKKFQWKFPKKSNERLEKQLIENEGSFMKKISLPAI